MATKLERAPVPWACLGCGKSEADGAVVDFSHPAHCRLCVMLALASPPLQAQTPSCWPMKPSIALAVHPDQVPEAIAYDKQHGLTGVEYRSSGQPIFKDPGAHARYLKHFKMHRKGRNKGALGCHSTEDPAKKLRQQVEAKLAKFNRGEL